MELKCHLCESYEIRCVVEVGERTYVFACRRCAANSGIAIGPEIEERFQAWQPLNARQMQEVGIQMELGRDFPEIPRA